MTPMDRVAAVLGAVQGLSEPGVQSAAEALMRALLAGPAVESQAETHTHEWLLAYRANGVKVFDCGCGQRKRELAGIGGTETEDASGVERGGSLSRVLIDASVIDVSPFITQ
jgi:hypothetical protein